MEAELPMRLSKNPWRLAFSAAILLSFVPRFVTMPEHVHGFRETQTALTLLWYKLQGVSIFNYETPLFGPPWKIPMEFPLHQLLAYPWLWLGMDPGHACRLTSLGCFYIAALLLYKICLHQLDDLCAARLSTLIFVWLPYNVAQSVSGLIDPCAVALSLTFLWLFIQWLGSGRIYQLILCITAGVLCALTKITIVAVLIMPFLGLTGMAMRNWWGKSMRTGPRQEILIEYINHNWRKLIGLAFIALIPLLAVLVWTKYCDHVKAASPFTRHLTSESLREWNFGFPGQKLSLKNWGEWLDMWRNFLFPGAFVFVALSALVVIVARPTKSSGVVLFAFSGCLCAVAIFFNLYRHPYYYISLAPFSAIILGVGAAQLVRGRPRWLGCGVLIGCVASTIPLWGNISLGKRYAEGKLGVRQVGEEVRRYTSESDWIISEQPDWYADIAFHSQRKTLIVCAQSLMNGGAGGLASNLRNTRFSTLVTTVRNSELLKSWPYHRMVFSHHGESIYVYKVGSEVLDDEPRRLLLDWGAEIDAAPGSPYTDKEVRVLGVLKPGSRYKLKMIYRANAGSVPYVIMHGGGCEYENLPIHDKLPNTDVDTSCTIEFCVPYGHYIVNPTLVFRNWGQSAAWAVRKVELLSN
jgi:hypothetical protein